MGCCQSRLKIKKKQDNTETISYPKYINTEKDEKIRMNIYDQPRIVTDNISDENIEKGINYSKLKIIKELSNSHDSKVYLLENNIVKKIYPDNVNGKIQFDNEIATYNYLKNCDFIPKLLYHSTSKRTLYIPYLKSAKKTPENKMLLKKYLYELEYKWFLRRIRRYHWDNVRTLNGQIYLIDFGSIPIISSKHGVKPSWEVLKKRPRY